MNEIKQNIKPLEAESPRPRNSIGGRGQSQKTIARREQLQGNPGTWFIWKRDSKTGGDTGQALRTLTGTMAITGVDRSTLPYQSTARRNDNGAWDIYVRYVGDNQEYATAE